MGNVQSDSHSNGQNGKSPVSRPAPPPPVSGNYPSLDDGDHDYEILSPGPGYNIPNRPAPSKPPVVTHQFSTHTLTSNYSGLEGVPFIVNPKFLPSGNSEKVRNY